MIHRTFSTEEEIEIVKEIARTNYRAVAAKYGVSRGRLMSLRNKHAPIYTEMTKDRATGRAKAENKIPAAAKAFMQPGSQEAHTETEVGKPSWQTAQENKDATAKLITSVVTSKQQHTMMEALKGKRSSPVPSHSWDEVEIQVETPDEEKPAVPEPCIIYKKSKTRVDLVLINPARGKITRIIRPEDRITCGKEQWIVVGWLDGRDQGNGCLNLIVAKEQYFEQISQRYLSTGLDSYELQKIPEERYAGSILENPFPEGTPEYGQWALNKQLAMSINRPGSGILMGYFLIPAFMLNRKEHYIVQNTVM